MCHHSNSKTRNLVQHRSHEASPSPGADVLSPALHAVQPWTRLERHRMFCTQLRTLLDDVCRGLDGQLRSLPTRFMLTLDTSELEVTLGCFFAMHANFGLGPIRLGPIRHRAAFDSFPFFFGAGEFVLLVSLVVAAALSSCL